MLDFALNSDELQNGNKFPEHTSKNGNLNHIEPIG